MRESELEALFDIEDGVDREVIRDGVLVYRTRTIRSGDMIEAEAYPLVTRRPDRAARQERTREAVARVNQKMIRRRLIRKAQINFSRETSVFLTLTYAQQPSEEAAARALDRYLGRLRYWVRRHGAELKYIAVTEISSTGRVHHHILLDGIPRDEAEEKWRGGFVNGRKYQDNPAGFTGLVRYMTKYRSTADPESGERRTRIRCSKNLIGPRVTVSDHKISRRKMERVACEEEESGREILERMYPGYEVRERPVIRRSEFYPGAYLYAVLWRRRE